LAMKKARLSIKEKGKPVQEVGFRLCLLKEAQKRFITHFFAENLNNGATVEVLIGGEPKNVDAFIRTVGKIGQGNTMDFDIAVRGYYGSIMKTSEYASYLTAEQLTIGIGALGGMNCRLGSIDGSLKDTCEFNAATAKSMSRIVEQLDELPKRLAIELKGS